MLSYIIHSYKLQNTAPSTHRIWCQEHRGGVMLDQDQEEQRRGHRDRRQGVKLEVQIQVKVSSSSFSFRSWRSYDNGVHHSHTVNFIRVWQTKNHRGSPETLFVLTKNHLDVGSQGQPCWVHLISSELQNFIELLLLNDSISCISSIV